MSGRSVCLSLAVALLGCTELAAPPTPVVEVVRSFGKPEVQCLIRDPQVDESSGIAPSRIDPAIFYTHNDSGDTARFFRFSLQGQVTGIFDVQNAEAADWEDMASTLENGRPYLYLADIGDNAGRRKSIQVYKVPEPKTSEASGKVSGTRIWDLKYPDEAHNAETILVSPDGRTMMIVTKAANRPSMVFQVPDPEKGGAQTLKRLGEIQVGMAIRESKLVTGGAISPDAKYVVLRTYLGAYEYAVKGPLTDWWKQEPTRIKTNLDLQGEGITYSTDGKALLTSSEKTPCQISKIPLLNSQ